MSVRQFQMALGSPGSRVEGIPELDQTLRIILTTPEGSVPGRPGFGTRIGDIQDAPSLSAKPLVVREVVRAVRVNEPRILVRAVSVHASADGKLRTTIRWAPRSAPTEMQTTEVDL